ncbi:THAP domain-containing protein 3 [Cyphomyrmex costatus]|uniref:THAP domain-containing protein 3 n=1 Tax=Cyphomyrmex costatus TaxID=456900 RepID=A0A151ID83_9HYME|nr:THAP domain-containing protein 3 [Cyphomyrmex costatus]
MPKNCCIFKCKNTRKQGFHFFRLPFTRPDILQIWINAIGGDFVPKKNDLICSAHFVHTDFLERPGASGVRLKNLAVPSVFLEAPTSDIPSIECSTICTIEHDTTTVMKSSTIPILKSGITSSIKFDTTVAPTAVEKNVPAVVWKSVLKPKESNVTVLASISSPKPQPTDNTIKLTTRKPTKVMSSSLFRLKRQEMSPWKKHMCRTIKTLRQKLRRKEEKINSLENLLKTLRYDNKLPSKHKLTVM